MYYVSRQRYWGEDINCVEIALGGGDYANPDMLGCKYPGEGVDYLDPREAAEAAIEIRKLWQADEPELEITVDYGCTLGFTMPFTDDNTDEELIAWANERYEKLEKCQHCGEPLPENERDVFYLMDVDEKFCSERCAERYWEEWCLDNEEDEEDEDDLS